MRKLKKTLAAMVMVSAILALGGCAGQGGAAQTNGSGAGETQPEIGELPVEGIPENYVLRLGASTLTGTYYQYAVGSIDLVSAHGKGWMASPITSSGSGESFALLEAGELDTVAASAISYACALDGVYAFDHPLAGGEMSLWTHISPEYLHICTRGDAPFESLADLKGAKVTCGLPGSGTYATGFRVLADLGIENPEEYFNMMYIAPADAIAALQDGSLDAAIYLVGLGSTPGQIAESAAGLKLIGLTDEEIAAATNNEKYFIKDEIPAGYYKGNDTAVQTLSDMQLMLSYDDVPENVVYQYVKLINEYKDELIAINPSFSAATAEETVEKWEGKIKFHPGAEKYYKELGLMQ